WIEAEGRALIGQRRFPDAQGVALFTCRAIGLREILPVHLPFEDAFVAAEAPYLRPLTVAGEGGPRAPRGVAGHARRRPPTCGPSQGQWRPPPARSWSSSTPKARASSR